MKSETAATFLCLLLATSGCAADATDTGAAEPTPSSVQADAGAAQDAAPDTEAFEAGVDSGGRRECNLLAQAGDFVAARTDPGAPPKPAGGVTQDGTYVLASVILYGATQAFDYQNKSTLQATGLTVNVVEDIGRGDTRKTGTGMVSGATLTLTETCAFPARPLRVERAEFTATSEQILLFGAVGRQTLVQTFQKL